MDLVYAGIDEAGYGPMIGPLCVARATLRIDNWSAGDPAPDLRSDSKTRIPIADSKKLKLANNAVRNHPLVHLERAVLAMLSTIGEMPRTDIELYEMLGVQLEGHPWYGGEPISLPLGSSADLLRIDGAHLGTVMRRKGVELLSIRVCSVGESKFNEVIRLNRSKAAVTEMALEAHLRAIRDGVGDEQMIRVVCDRQGGRTHHSEMLSRVWNGVLAEEESERASRYTLGDRLGITFTPKADDGYFPVALASMAAKLVRELAMMRVNRYWNARVHELKPTAGYVQDARRWLDDVSSVMTNEERATMVRRA
jgi:ribonuclease HII